MPDFLAIYETGVRYHLVHGLAVFVAAWLAGEDQTRSARLAGVLFIVGILLFSGSLYLLALTGIRGFGAITPLGGLAWIAAWAIVALRVRLGEGRRRGSTLTGITAFMPLPTCGSQRRRSESAFDVRRSAFVTFPRRPTTPRPAGPPRRCCRAPIPRRPPCGRRAVA